LVEHGADINKNVDNKYTTLTIAFNNIEKKENENIVKYLIEHRADLNTTVKNN